MSCAKFSVKSARTNAGLTLQQAAISLGITVPTLISYEKHRVVPSIQRMKAMAELYNIPAANIDFLGFEA